MLESFVVSVRSEAGLKECVDWCRSPQSRKCFPGTQDVVDKFGTFFYNVDMRAPGASESVVTVEEHLREPEGDEHQASFESGLLWTWSTMEFVSAWAEYRFTQAEDGTQIDYHQRYMVPGRAIGVVVNHGRLARSVETAAQKYLEELARCAGEMS
jgi:hypothetical protein